jgi:DNA topoisomerase-1
VAKKLGNTPAICRKCYVHPEVINGYLDGTLIALLKNGSGKTVQAIEGLEEAEGEVMGFLQHVLEQTAAAA